MTEAEATTQRADTVVDATLLTEARFIERRQIECANDSLFVGRGPDLQRWNELGKGARPAAWAILRALESRPEKG